MVHHTESLTNSINHTQTITIVMMNPVSILFSSEYGIYEIINKFK